MNTKHIRIKDYNYDLPDERIAKFPLPQRDKSKLLVYNHGEVSQDEFSNITRYLPQGALMVSTTPRLFKRACISEKKRGRSSKYSSSNQLCPPITNKCSKQRAPVRGIAWWEI